MDRRTSPFPSRVEPLHFVLLSSVSVAVQCVRVKGDPLGPRTRWSEGQRRYDLLRGEFQTALRLFLLAIRPTIEPVRRFLIRDNGASAAPRRRFLRAHLFFDFCIPPQLFRHFLFHI